MQVYSPGAESSYQTLLLYSTAYLSCIYDTRDYMSLCRAVYPWQQRWQRNMTARTRVHVYQVLIIIPAEQQVVVLVESSMIPLTLIGRHLDITIGHLTVTQPYSSRHDAVTLSAVRRVPVFWYSVGRERRTGINVASQETPHLIPCVCLCLCVCMYHSVCVSWFEVCTTVVE